MQLLKTILQGIKDRKFSRTLGFKAKLRDIEVRSYNEEMAKLLEKRAIAIGKQKAHKHIKSAWRRRKFNLSHTA